jgi:hypothetical protein
MATAATCDATAVWRRDFTGLPGGHFRSLGSLEQMEFGVGGNVLLPGYGFGVGRDMREMKAR